ncbi:hypothetical protein N7E81_01525 [Reichenbachiella carrageenanivorans]|uniref:Outer membrane lipoprotein-sorting protein n=1 Tax=Reichenbachiella carrageenanivorans TaxID=2979869 RepID=A0ABY6D0T8_9BACT|nr:hypothetical protein [Reichenbachiella carrageenanivorans]UXX79787.1 hypothetical protein N7E81_01525 [Reichenbachiella carrageenanivorans]
MRRYLIGLTLLMACNAPTHLSEKEMGQFILNPDNGLIKKKEVNGLDLQVYYKPTGMLVAQELDGKNDSIAYSKYYEKYDSYAYFILDLSSNEKNALYQSGSYERFSENLQTLAFRMDQFTNLTTSASDTIPVADFIYPRMYGMSNSATVMFVFNNEKLLQSDWVSFNLSEFGMGSGNQQFRFEIEDIQNVPKLSVN